MQKLAMTLVIDFHRYRKTFFQLLILFWRLDDRMFTTKVKNWTALH